MNKVINEISNRFKVLEVSKQTDEQFTILVELNDLPKVVATLYYEYGGWMSTAVANDERAINKNFALYYVLSIEGAKQKLDYAPNENYDASKAPIEADEKFYINVKAFVDPKDKTFPSVTPLVPACVWYEREFYDMFGIVAEGLPDKRRLVLSDDFPDDIHPLLKDSIDYRFRPEPKDVDNEPEYKFIKTTGDKITAIPLGPLHITADEPGHFRLYCDGDTIVDADYRLFYQHRGMEKLAENRLNYTQMPFLAERVCGICGFAHSIACANAAENVSGIEVPARAQAIRVLSQEIERIHSHLLNLGLLCEVCGNVTAFMHFFRVREFSLDIAQILTGGRKTYGTIAIGGVRKDLTLSEIKKILELLDIIETGTKEMWEVVMNDKRQINRWKNVGVLDPMVARDFSPVGPVIRASGFGRDVRHDHPNEFYKKLDFKMHVEETGDVLGRAKVRYHDLMNTIAMIRQCIDIMPGGAIMSEQNWRIKPYSYALGFDEAPRGENVHWIMQGDMSKVYRWRCRASTYNNWSSLRYQMRGNTIADAALIVASLDPCYSCTERTTLVDIKTGKARVINEKELKQIARGKKI